MNKETKEVPNQSMRQTEPVFENLDEAKATEIDSLCMNCHDNGVTKLLLTKIPHFKEIILMAFECQHCGFKNNEVQSASAIQEKGMKQTLTVNSQNDLSRQVVKSEYASIKFEEIDFEIPSTSQRGILSTIDGILDRCIEGLKQGQDDRKEKHPELYEQLEKILIILQEYYDGKQTFTLTLDDPTGNSYVENLNTPNNDMQIRIVHYARTKEQEQQIGLPVESSQEPEEEFDLQEQVHVFPGNCSRCNTACETKMHMLDIPHFKEVIIMSTNCDSCGFKSNEVKAGGAVAPKGMKITLLMTEMDDLSRDILKSESCSLEIPEIDLQLNTGTLGGRFTTVEGLLSQVHEELEGRAGFLTGDSSTDLGKQKFKVFLAKLEKVLSGQSFPVTLILTDPLANSHLQNLYAPDPDPNMTFQEFERSWDDNEKFGLNDIQTENY